MCHVFMHHMNSVEQMRSQEQTNSFEFSRIGNFFRILTCEPIDELGNARSRIELYNFFLLSGPEHSTLNQCHSDILELSIRIKSHWKSLHILHAVEVIEIVKTNSQSDSTVAYFTQAVYCFRLIFMQKMSTS